MANGAHVPKFGNWDGDNIPYTTYFENARKDKSAGTKIFNPNDPEENPEAFMPQIVSHENELRKQHHNAYNGTSSASQASSGKAIPAEKPQRHARHRSRDSDGSPANGETPASYLQKAWYYKTSKSGSGSEISSSDTSLLRSDHRSKGSRHSPENSYGHMQSPLRQGTKKVGNTWKEEAHHRAASVPKFGGWDETDAKSGEGYTIIFNKVKEEKQNAASKLPPLANGPRAYQSSQANIGKHRHSRSKICCCFSPSADE